MQNRAKPETLLYEFDKLEATIIPVEQGEIYLPQSRIDKQSHGEQTIEQIEILRYIHVSNGYRSKKASFSD